MAPIAATSSAAPSPTAIGRQLRRVREQMGLTRIEVARSAGLTRRELAAYERGKAMPESDLRSVAGSCGVAISELVPTVEWSESGSVQAVEEFFSVVRAEDLWGDPLAAPVD